MNFKMPILLILLVVSSCNRQEYDPNFYEEFSIPKTSGKDVFDGDPEPKRPPIEEAMKGVFGVDSDDDGVRDDVEIWINRYFDDPLKRKAYKEHYRHHALKLAYTKNKEMDKLESFVDEHRIFYSSCLLSLFEKKEIHLLRKEMDKVLNLFVNTRARKKSYSDFVYYNRKTTGTIDDKKNYHYIISRCPFEQEERNEHAKKYRERYDF